MQAIDRYQVREEIARGAMGVVYRAHDPTLGRDVAVKLLLSAGLPSPEDVERFRREAQVTARLTHPNIVGIQSAGVHNGQPFLVMDLIEGESLHQRIKRWGPLDPGEAVRISERLARALDHAHRQGFLHRDVKPSNVLIDGNGEPLLADFGLAKSLNRDVGITLSGEVLGTPVYMPPEQAQGQRERIGPHSDVYSLGATLFEMLSGEAPFRGSSVIEVLDSVVTRPAPRLSAVRGDLDPRLEEILQRCLAKAPEERYGSASDLADALAALSVSAEPSGERSPALFAGAGLAVGLLLGGVLALALRPRAASTSSPEPEPSPARAASTGVEGEVADALVEQARLLAEEDLHEIAIRLCDRALTLRPGHAYAHVIRGFAHYQSRDKQRQKLLKTGLEAAAELDPQGVAPLILRAIFHEDKTAAASLLGQAIAKRPKHAWLYFARALNHMARGKAGADDYRRDLDQAVALNPRYVSVYLYRAQLLKHHGQLDEAVSDCEAAIALNAARGGLHLERARILYRLERYQAARLSSLLVQQFGTKAEKAKAHHLRGWISIKQKRYQNARVEADKAKQKAPTNGEGWHVSGWAWYSQRKFERAERDLRKALALMTEHKHPGRRLVARRLEEARRAQLRGGGD